MIVLSDVGSRAGLYPFSVTQHVADLRVGILTIKEKWEILTGAKVNLVSQDVPGAISANLLPEVGNFTQILHGKLDGVARISRPWHIPEQNGRAIAADVELLTRGRHSAPIPMGVTAIHPSRIFIEEGAILRPSILNAETGLIYIAKGAEIMEGSMIRGPFSLGPGSLLKMGSKIYGATTLGPKCTGGGEIKNSVMMGYSNKGHDGYLGDSVLGNWCNMGAGSSVSNVKNTGGEVWLSLPGFEKESAGTKAGLYMGDYSRTAINTSFNTGSLVGICCSIHGTAHPKKFTAGFTWGNERYSFPKVISDIRNWKRMKGEELSPAEISILEDLYKQTF